MKNVIVFAHTKGGVGKSTLSWHLAHDLKRRGEKVSILDLDFQQTLFFINALREDAGLEGMEVHQVNSADALIETFENNEGTLVVDVGGFDSDINRIALSYADTIVVPVSNSATEVIGFKTFEAILEEIDADQVHVLLNNIHHAMQDFTAIREAVATVQQTTLLDSVIRRRKDYDACMHFGKSIFETSNTLAQSDIQRLTDEIIH